MAAAFVLATGCRREETLLFRAADLPDPGGVALDAPAKMRVIYGTKGGRSPGDPEKVGTGRTLRFSRDFLIELHDYKRLRRPFALSKWRAANPGRTAPVELFLNDRTGLPFTPNHFARLWRSSSELPFAGFTPHAGRHFFACTTLLQLLKEESAAVSALHSTLPRSMVMQNAENLVNLYLRPVMGHVDQETTERYLSWVADRLWVAPYRFSWSAELDGKEA